MAQPYYAPQSARAKEMAKWEKPYRYEHFPLMVYRARRNEKTGKVAYNDPEDENFSRSCWKTVRDDHELEQARADGWREDPREALDVAKREEERISEAAANRYHAEQRLSEKARAEAERKDEELSDGVSHVPEIPEEPLRAKGTETVALCSAKTKAGKRCKFTAVSEGRCKKHAAH